MEMKPKNLYISETISLVLLIVLITLKKDYCWLSEKWILLIKKLDYGSIMVWAQVWILDLVMKFFYCVHYYQAIADLLKNTNSFRFKLTLSLSPMVGTILLVKVYMIFSKYSLSVSLLISAATVLK